MMPGFIKLASTTDLPAPGEAKEFLCGEKMVCVANVNGTLSALDNVCLHRGGPLAQGHIEDGKVVCPWHGWQFDAQTGQIGHHTNARTQVFPIKVEGEDVFIDVL
ncbi:MAG TPA: Rieske (2Fe-2S) protein [Terriglobales bacterium]|nr:Rieske (2Fe-2S) protein [Terriglobales bacterium]